MFLHELFESKTESDSDYCEKYLVKYTNAYHNFDTYVQHYGTDGANIIFRDIILSTKDPVVDWTIKKEKFYDEMVSARNALETKIKNSNGLSY